jgi:hypothetical protein
MRTLDMFGRNTFETIMIDDDGRTIRPIETCGGPKIWACWLGMVSDKLLYHYPEHLRLLYDRFSKANPTGVVLGPEFSFDEYAPAGLTEAELNKLEEEGKIFVNIFLRDEEQGYPHVRKYLPELFEPGMIEKMAADPWLDVRLLGRAQEEGHVPLLPGESDRWSPEWRAYCDRLIASGEYK